jgi:hypothetical protein
MNFILFNIVLLVAGFPAVFLFSVGLMACMLPMAPFLKSENPPKAVICPIAAIAGAYQIYFWGLWAAFCVAITIRFTQRPEVTWDWLYWICGFMWCGSLIGWLAHKEQQSSATVADARAVQSGTNFYSLVAVAAFLVFAFAPGLAEWPYGWFMNLTGLSKYMNG